MQQLTICIHHWYYQLATKYFYHSLVYPLIKLIYIHFKKYFYILKSFDCANIRSRMSAFPKSKFELCLLENHIFCWIGLLCSRCYHIIKASVLKGKLFLNIVSGCCKMNNREGTLINELLHDAIKSAFQGLLDHHDRKKPVICELIKLIYSRLSVQWHPWALVDAG